jgi:hypothetical protein
MARCLVDPVDSVILHSPPEVLTAEVSTQEGQRLAFGKDLPPTQQSPMCRLTRAGDRIEREDVWPSDADVGAIVLLPGGEAGVLKSWWHADDRKEWRWQIEFYNSIR